MLDRLASDSELLRAAYLLRRTATDDELGLDTEPGLDTQPGLDIELQLDDDEQGMEELSEEQILAWLDPALNSTESVDRLLSQLRPSEPGLLGLRRVSTLVNSPSNDAAALIRNAS